MKEILNVARLEFITLKKKIVRIFIIMFIFITLASLAFPPQLISIIASMFTGYIVQPIFSMAEKNSFNKLYGVLPAKRKSFVFGRFFLTAVMVLAAMLLFIAIGYISYAWMPLADTELFGEFAYLTVEWERESFTIPFAAAVGFFLGCIFIMPTFIIDYVFGVSKEAPISFGFGIFVGVSCFVLDGIFEPDYGSIIYNLVKFFVDYRFLSYIVLIGGGILLLTLGAVISHLATRKREL